MASKELRTVVVRRLEKIYGMKDAKRVEKVIFQSQGVYEEIAYEIMGWVDMGKGDITPDQLIEDIHSMRIQWQSTAAEKYRKQNERTEKPTVTYTPGTFQCSNPKCRSTNCFFFTKQTRSADESETVFVVCRKCHRHRTF